DPAAEGPHPDQPDRSDDEPVVVRYPHGGQVRSGEAGDADAADDHHRDHDGEAPPRGHDQCQSHRRNHGHGQRQPLVPRATGVVTSAKKSWPLSSTTMNAGKSSTSMRHTASIPSSGYSSTSTLRMQSWARRAAGPPMEPR